jgi:hypothetical protein
VIIGRINLNDIAESIVLITGGGINAAFVWTGRFINFV